MKKIQQSIASILVFIMLLGCGGFSSFAEGEIVISASDIAIEPTGGNWSNYSYIVIYGMLYIILVYGVYGPGYNPVDFIYGGF